jgi:hypothetical protein
VDISRKKSKRSFKRSSKVKSQSSSLRSRSLSARLEKDSFHSSSVRLPKGLPSEAKKRPQGRGARPLKDAGSLSANAEAWFGPQAAGRRKVARPFIPGRPLEACFRSRLARGRWSLSAPTNVRKVRQLVEFEAKRAGVELLKLRNSGDRLSVFVRTHERTCLSRFLRGVGGKVPRLVAGTKKSRPLSRKTKAKNSSSNTRSSAERKFWDGLVATRVL